MANGTLKSLVLRAYKASSTTDYRKRELKHLTETFCNNGYPLAIIKYTMEKIEDVSIIIPTTSRKVTYSTTFKSDDFFSVLLAGMFGGYNEYKSDLQQTNASSNRMILII